MAETPSPALLRSFEAFAIELASVAAAVALPLFRGDHGLEDKGGAKDGDFDPVTRADRDAEAAIRRLIAQRHPSHGVIGEEYGEDRPDAAFVWVLDPIDGTRAFVAGLPLWTTLIALRREGVPIVGLIAQPYLGEVFVGSSPGARLIRGEASAPIHVRPCASLTQALIATTDPAIFRGEQRAAWGRVRRAARIARLGCDAYAYAMVALGRIDLVVEAGLKAWDIEAAIPLLAGAGGRVTDWTGQPVGPRGGDVVIAGDPACLAAALALLSSSADQAWARRDVAPPGSQL